MVDDLGGVETLSAGQQQLIKRCAMISVACELMENEAISGQPLNAIAYGTLTGHLTRTLNALGLKREPIDVTPALHQYLDALPAWPSAIPDFKQLSYAKDSCVGRESICRHPDCRSYPFAGSARRPQRRFAQGRADR